jgi:hypothetical protein
MITGGFPSIQDAVDAYKARGYTVMTQCDPYNQTITLRKPAYEAFESAYVDIYSIWTTTVYEFVGSEY